MRAIGPTCETGPNGLAGQAGTRPNVGLSPGSPQNAHGIRIEPPPSVPSASGTMPAASAAELPPLEPPGVFRRSHGLRVTPVSALSVTPFQPSSGVVVLPGSTAPERRSEATTGASSSHGPAGSIAVEPRSVGQPLVTSRSLIDDRHAVERPGRLAAAPALLGGARLGQRRLAVDEAERVELAVALRDPRQGRLRRLDGRALARAVGGDELGGGRRRHAHPSSPVAAGRSGRGSTATTSRRTGGPVPSPGCSSTIRLWQAVTPEPQ